MKKIFTLLVLLLAVVGAKAKVVSADVSFVGYDKSQNPIVQTDANNKVTITVSDFAGTNNGYVKCANGTSLKIVAPTSTEIKTVVLTLVGGSSTTDINIEVSDNDTWENPFGNNGKTGNFTWSNDENTSSSLTFTVNSTNTKSEIRISNINVQYEDGEEEVQAATPVISPAGSIDFAESIDVTITCTTNGATILYSTDGTNYTEYTKPITLTETATVYAKATKNGLTDSDIVSATYNKVDATLGTAVDNKTWTFDNFVEKDYKVTQTIDGITLFGTSSSFMTIVSGSGSMDGISFSKRIKMNGGSSETARLLVFNVAAGKHNIKVYGNSGSSGKSRAINIATGIWNNIVATKKVDGLDKVEYELTSDEATTCFIQCSENVQIAGVVVEPVATSVPVTITSCGYATLTSDQALDFSGVEGLTAFIATGIDGDKVKTQAIESAPANTGLILKGEAGATYDIPVFTGNPDDVSANKMVGDAKASITLDDNEGYILSKNDGKFHPCSAGTLAAGKAYLAIAPQSAKVLDIEFDDPTAISAVTAEQQNVDVYNLQGVRVSNTSQKGVYIVNGKKIVK